MKRRSQESAPMIVFSRLTGCVYVIVAGQKHDVTTTFDLIAPHRAAYRLKAEGGARDGE